MPEEIRQAEIQNPLEEIGALAQNIDEVFKRDPRTLTPDYRHALIEHMREERKRWIAKSERRSRGPRAAPAAAGETEGEET